MLLLKKGGLQHQSYTLNFLHFCVVSFILFCFSILSVDDYSCVSVSVCVEYLNFMSYTSYQVSMLYQSYLALYCVGGKSQTLNIRLLNTDFLTNFQIMNFQFLLFLSCLSYPYTICYNTGR